jgi:CRISPR/Cas system CSM-associated protein Csm2 small subunit
MKEKREKKQVFKEDKNDKEAFWIVIVGLVIIGFFLSGGKDKKSQSPCNKKYRGHIIPPKVKASEKKVWDTFSKPGEKGKLFRRKLIHDLARYSHITIWWKTHDREPDELVRALSLVENKYNLKSWPLRKEKRKITISNVLEGKKLAQQFWKLLRDRSCKEKDDSSWCKELKEMLELEVIFSNYVLANKDKYGIRDIEELKRCTEDLMKKIREDEDLKKFIYKVERTSITFDAWRSRKKRYNLN